MTFETKISGTKVDGFEIKPLFGTQFINLTMCIEKVQKQETMNWLLDTLRFSKGEKDWWATIDFDTDFKLAVLDNDEYEGYRKEFEDYFGENWMKYYIRFGH